MSLLLNISTPFSGQLALPKPVLDFVQQSPALTTVQLRNYFVGTTFQASQDPSFASSTISNNDGIFVNLGVGVWHFRGIAPGTQYSDRETANLQQTPLRTIAITADAGLGEVVITHDVVVGDADDIEMVQVWRRANQTGEYTIAYFFDPANVEIANLNPLVDINVINGTRYDYYFVAIPASINNSPSQSNIDDATPQAVTPQLSTPTSFNAAQKDNTNADSNTTLKCTWGAVSGANQYTLSWSKNGTPQTPIVGSALTQYITDLSIGDIIALSLVAQDTTAQKTDSNAATLNRTMQDVVNVAYLTLEDFGGLDYEKPLDGRRELWNWKSPESFRPENIPAPTDADFAAAQQAYEDYCNAEIAAERFNDYTLITYTPWNQLSQDDKDILQNEGLTGEDYTMITTPGDEFTDTDNGMSFVGYFNHVWPNDINLARADEYIPGSQLARYATVCHVAGPRKMFVDKLFNGGNPADPQIQENGQGVIFSENSLAWQQTLDAWKTGDGSKTEIRLKELALDGNVIRGSYFVTQPGQFTTGSINRNLKVTTQGSRSRLKLGYEAKYREERTYYGRTSVVNDPDIHFNLSGHQGHFGFENVQIIPPLTGLKPYKQMWTGTKHSGVAYVINGENYAYWHALQLGNALTGNERPGIGIGLMQGGQKSGTAPLNDVSAMCFDLHVNCHYAGGWCAGQKGGAAFGGLMEVTINCTFDFEDQEKWQPTTEDNLTMKIITNKAWLGSGVENKDIYRGAIFEITSPSGNFFSNNTFGGSNRSYYIVAKHPVTGQGLAFHGVGGDINKIGGLYEFFGVYDMCYRGNTTRNTWGGVLASGGPGATRDLAYSARRMMTWETIAQSGQTYYVSREYNTNKTDSQLTSGTLGTVDTVVPNFIRTSICWTTVLNKHAVDFDEDDRAYMQDKVPIHLAPGAVFTIPAYEGSTHDTTKQYTVVRQERGFYPDFAVEFVNKATSGTADPTHPTPARSQINYQAYRYFMLGLNDNLPAELPTVFAINIVSNPSEDLIGLDSFDALTVYYGLGRFTISGQPAYSTSSRAQETNLFTESFWRLGEGLGHGAYTLAQVSKYALNCDFRNSFYRENTTSVNTNTLSTYNKGIFMINCRNNYTGQFAGNGSHNSSRRSQWPNARAIHAANPEYVPFTFTSEGIPYPPYIGYYNSPGAIANPDDPANNLVVSNSTDNAPGLPTTILNLLTP